MNDTATATAHTDTAHTGAVSMRRRLTVVAASALSFVMIAALCDDKASSKLSFSWSSLSLRESTGNGYNQKTQLTAFQAELERTLEEDEDQQDDEANEDNAGDEDGGNDDQQQNENDDAAQANDDAQNNNGDDALDDDLNGGNGGFDDYFYEGINDDTYGNTNNIDDFYAFEEDPRPPTLFPLSYRVVLGYVIAAMALTLGASGGIGGGTFSILYGATGTRGSATLTLASSFILQAVLSFPSLFSLWVYSPRWPFPSAQQLSSGEQLPVPV